MLAGTPWDRGFLLDDDLPCRVIQRFEVEIDTIFRSKVAIQVRSVTYFTSLARSYSTQNGVCSSLHVHPNMERTPNIAESTAQTSTTVPHRRVGREERGRDGVLPAQGGAVVVLAGDAPPSVQAVGKRGI